jgi:hypothetical protein
MKRHLPRITAALAFLIGLVGLGVSLPLLATAKTSLFFLLGATAWGFLLWRALSPDFREVFYAGWLWSAVLHMGMLPLSVFIPRILGTDLPLPLMILVMFILSMTGFFQDLFLSRRKVQLSPEGRARTTDAEQAAP